MSVSDEFENKYLQFKQQQFFLGELDIDSTIKETSYIEVKGKKWLMKSQEASELPQNAWVQQFEGESHTVFLIFGLGYQEHILKLCKRYPNNIVVVYEPNDHAIIKLIENENFDDVLKLKNLFVIGGKNKEWNYSVALENVIFFENYKHVMVGCLPNYMKAYDEDYDFFSNAIKKRIEVISTEKNTAIAREKEMATNTLYNTAKAFGEAGIVELRVQMEKTDINNDVAVLISAGPSLDKNIHILKEYQNRCFIVCVDVALKAAISQGIIPDIVVAIDSHVGRVASIDDEKYRTIPLLTDLKCCADYVKNFKGRIFYTGYDNEYINSILSNYGKELKFLPTGGSVANTAFSMIESIGFKNIILIGQDLAYPDNRLHADNTISGEKPINPEADSKYYYVEAVDGGKVLTENNMDMYRQWFEIIIGENKEIRVIDATEGGALIHGTEIMTLKEALEQTVPEKARNYKDIINNSDYFLSQNEEYEAVETFCSTMSEIDDVIKMLLEKRKFYVHMQELNDHRCYNSNEFRMCVDEVGKFTAFMEAHKEFILYKMYFNESRYEIRDNLGTKKESIFEELDLVVKSGIQMIDAYIESAKLLKADWSKVSLEL